MSASMRRPPTRLLLVTFDRSRGLALLRGPKALEVANAVHEGTPRWSQRVRGWVVDEAVATDAIAYAEYRSFIVRVGEVRS